MLACSGCRLHNIVCQLLGQSGLLNSRSIAWVSNWLVGLRYWYFNWHTNTIVKLTIRFAGVRPGQGSINPTTIINSTIKSTVSQSLFTVWAHYQSFTVALPSPPIIIKVCQFSPVHTGHPGCRHATNNAQSIMPSTHGFHRLRRQLNTTRGHQCHRLTNSSRPTGFNKSTAMFVTGASRSTIPPSMCGVHVWLTNTVNSNNNN